MNRIHLSLLAWTLTGFLFMGCQSSTPEDEHGHSHENGDADHTHDVAGTDHGGPGHTHANEPAYTFLSMNGDFEMDPVNPATRNDPRNPSRIRLATTDEAGTGSRMAFYAHHDPNVLVADCGYQYSGSRPDPHYFPDESKTSIWDVFELTETFSGSCEDYAVVISRSPHGDPVHLHLRYGTNAESLLAMSTMPEDSTTFDPWWALYCEPGRTTSCD